MARIKELQKRMDILHDELYTLHYAELSTELYQQRRSEIEYEIASLEDAIDLEKTMAPFKYMLYGFIVVAVGLLVWAYLKSK